MKKQLILLVILCQYTFSVTQAQQQAVSKGNGPKIINIVNFIRDIEPRDSAVTKDVLYQTVVNQIQLMKQYHVNQTTARATCHW